jgi:prepilin-type N-terminal cleavage/methylation domain-containing protein
MKPRHGFTLIELLIVIVIIGILAAIAIPKFSASKGQAYTARLKTDLRNFATAQENYFYDNQTYATTSGAITNFVPSDGTTITVLEATASGWSAKATSTFTQTSCVLVYGATLVAPATTDGIIACQ